MKGLRPVELPSMATSRGATVRAYDTLRAQIVSGEIPAGTLLSEVQVAGSLGVSRTPLREALRALLGEGLLEEGANRQVRVRLMGEGASRELSEILRAMMALTLGPAAQLRDEEAIDRLRLITIRVRRALRDRDIEMLLDEEDAFLLQLAHAGGQLMLEENLRRLLGQARLASLPQPPLPRRVRADATLDVLADCLEEGNAQGARRAFETYPFRLLAMANSD